LGTDYIDLYQVHFWDADTPIEETMATLDGFVRKGLVRYLGCSNFSGSQIVESQWAAERVNGTPFVSLQPRYSLIARQIETDVLTAAERHGLGTMVYSPLGGGVLTGKYKRDEEPPADSRIGRRMAAASAGAGGGPSAAGRRALPSGLSDRNFDIVEAVEKAAAELGTTPTAVSIAWVLARPGVTSVIIGPRTHDQLDENLAGFDLELPDDVMARLDEVSSNRN
jgi:aryl-alcohol dehydrogenase-like predicted oxidoreductase